MTLDELGVLVFGVALENKEVRERLLSAPLVGMHPNQQKWQAAALIGREALAKVFGISAGDLRPGQSLAEWAVDRYLAHLDNAHADHVEKVMNRNLSIRERGRAALNLGER
jgi:hypothetical protein